MDRRLRLCDPLERIAESGKGRETGQLLREALVVLRRLAPATRAIVAATPPIQSNMGTITPRTTVTTQSTVVWTSATEAMTPLVTTSDMHMTPGTGMADTMIAVMIIRLVTVVEMAGMGQAMANKPHLHGEITVASAVLSALESGSTAGPTDDRTRRPVHRDLQVEGEEGLASARKLTWAVPVVVCVQALAWRGKRVLDRAVHRGGNGGIAAEAGPPAELLPLRDHRLVPVLPGGMCL